MARILLVEDDTNVRVIFEHVLFDAGYDVDATQTVGGGEALLRRRNYDLIVADGRLPDGTGLVLADRAKEKGIPALIATGYAFTLCGDDPDVDLANYNLLLKPVRPDELVEAVREALSEKDGESEVPR
jgi:two-component system response regulator HydG